MRVAESESDSENTRFTVQNQKSDSDNLRITEHVEECTFGTQDLQ